VNTYSAANQLTRIGEIVLFGSLHHQKEGGKKDWEKRGARREKGLDPIFQRGD